MKNKFKISIYQFILIGLGFVFTNSCKNETQLTLPELKTNAIIYISTTSATCKNIINSDGGLQVTSRGVCWNKEHIPTITDSITIDGSGMGGFTSVIKGLTTNSTYFLRAYATNSIGTAYGNILTFKTTGMVTDIDGNLYHTVTIGAQTWMVENLKTTKYRNGDPIPHITDNANWISLSTGAYCDYNNIPLNSMTYGRLYNFYTIADSRFLCPVGWHVPSSNDWSTLTNYQYMGGINSGGKLKEEGLTHWASPNIGANNETGFTALPGGKRTTSFEFIGNYGSWWSSAENDSSSAIYWYLCFDNDEINCSLKGKTCGMSVRCIKDSF